MMSCHHKKTGWQNGNPQEWRSAASLNKQFFMLSQSYGRRLDQLKTENVFLYILGSMTVERLGKLTALSDRKGVLIPVGFTWVKANHFSGVKH